MAKVPYIPLYIGDWEQDTNSLSLQTEAAWLKVIIKMFKDDKSGIYKTSTKALQNLWKCDAKEVQNIISELLDNNVCAIEIDENAMRIVFKNRRMIREKSISKARTKAVQNRYKPSSNSLQNTEYDNENDNESVKGGTGEKESEGEKPKSEIDPGAFLVPRMFTAWKAEFPKYLFSQDNDWPALHDLAHAICDQLAQPKDFADKNICESILKMWGDVVRHIKGNKHYSTYNLQQVFKYIQSILQSFHQPKEPDKSGIQYLYDRFCEDGKIDHRLISEDHYQQLNEKNLIAIDDALIERVTRTRLRNLETPMNEEERKLHEAYKAGDPENPLIQQDRIRIELNAKKTAVISYFKKRNSTKAKTVI